MRHHQLVDRTLGPRWQVTGGREAHVHGRVTDLVCLVDPVVKNLTQLLLEGDAPLLHGDPPVPCATRRARAAVGVVAASAQEAALRHRVGRDVDDEKILFLGHLS